MATLTMEQLSLISNRYKTITEAYNRGTTIDELAKKAHISYGKARKILNDDNYFHGIKRTKGTKAHPIKPITDLTEFTFLLDANEIDSLRD